MYSPRNNYQYSNEILEFTIENCFDSTGISSYEYKIEGLDSDTQWHSIGSRNFVAIRTKLEEKDYTICGRIVNQKGDHSDSICTKAVVSKASPQKTG